MEEILYLEADEEITSVIDKLNDLPGHSVALVLPKHAQLTSSVVNLRLLLAEAKKRKKTIAIVTQDKTGTKLATQVGIPVFASVTDDIPVEPEIGPRPSVDDVIELNETQKYQSDEAEKVVLAPPTPVDSPVPVKRYDEVDRVSPPIPQVKSVVAPVNVPTVLPKAAVPPLPMARNMRGRMIAVASALVVLLAGAGWWFFWWNWHATATLTLKSEPFETKTDIIIDNSVQQADAGTGHIPGQRVETEASKTATFDAKGKKDVGTKASGTITVSNRLGETVSLPVGTRFDRSSLLSLSTEAVSVPAATVTLNASGDVVVKPGTVSVHVEAGSSGDQYNFSPGDFIITSLTGTQRDKVTAANQAAFGGGESKTITILTNEDVDSARQSLLTQSTDELLQGLQKQSPNLTIIKEGVAVEVVESSTDKQPNEETEHFSLTAKIRARAIGFVPADYQSMVVARAQGSVPAGKQLVVNQDDSIDTSIVKADVGQGQLSLAAILHTQMVVAIDQQSLASQITGKTVSDAQQFLGSQVGVVSAAIQLQPSIRSSLPKEAKRITVELRRE